MSKLSANRPEPGGKMYHISLSKGELPPYVLLPGDPGRVGKIGKLLGDYEMISHNREFKAAKCVYDGMEIGICSTGIGGPSTAIAIEELASIGCHTFVRVGTTGCLSEGIQCGDLVINHASVRCEGTSKEYVIPEYPACASHEVTLALIQACEARGYEFHVGIGASTDSFYVGQSRPGFGGFLPSFKKELLNDLRDANVLNFEMESSTIFTLCNLYGLRAGCIGAAIANRETDEFKDVGMENAIYSSARSLKTLSRWDSLKKKHSKKYFYPDLLKL